MHTYIVIKSFTGALGTFAAGTSADFEDGPAAILKEKGVVALEGSEAHQAFLVNQDAFGKAAAEPVLETKPAPAAKRSTKAK